MEQKVRRIFLPWKYEKELNTVNERSRQGFHLTRASRWSRTEEQNGDVIYRYALDCKEGKGFTELLYEKQGWELVCAQGQWLWFRKRWEETRQETEYEIHGEPRHAIADYLHRRIKPLDALRNALLVLAFLLILVPGGVTANLTPRIACVPLFLCLIPVKIAENMRKALGEHKRK